MQHPRSPSQAGNAAQLCAGPAAGLLSPGGGGTPNSASLGHIRSLLFGPGGGLDGEPTSSSASVLSSGTWAGMSMGGSEQLRGSAASEVLSRLLSDVQHYDGTSPGNVQMLQQDLRNLTMIGRGGCGIVYQAEWRGAHVAVKLVVSANAEHLQHSVMEAITGRFLAHPQVVHTYAAVLVPVDDALSLLNPDLADTGADIEVEKLLAGPDEQQQHLLQGEWDEGDLGEADEGHAAPEGAAGESELHEGRAALDPVHSGQVVQHAASAIAASAPSPDVQSMAKAEAEAEEVAVALATETTAQASWQPQHGEWQQGREQHLQQSVGECQSEPLNAGAGVSGVGAQSDKRQCSSPLQIPTALGELAAYVPCSNSSRELCGVGVAARKREQQQLREQLRQQQQQSLGLDVTTAQEADSTGGSAGGTVWPGQQQPGQQQQGDSVSDLILTLGSIRCSNEPRQPLAAATSAFSSASLLPAQASTSPTAATGPASTTNSSPRAAAASTAASLTKSPSRLHRSTTQSAANAAPISPASCATTFPSPFLSPCPDSSLPPPTYTLPSQRPLPPALPIPLPSVQARFSSQDTEPSASISFSSAHLRMARRGSVNSRPASGSARLPGDREASFTTEVSVCACPNSAGGTNPCIGSACSAPHSEDLSHAQSTSVSSRGSQERETAAAGPAGQATQEAGAAAEAQQGAQGSDGSHAAAMASAPQPASSDRWESRQQLAVSSNGAGGRHDSAGDGAVIGGASVHGSDVFAQSPAPLWSPPVGTGGASQRHSFSGPVQHHAIAAHAYPGGGAAYDLYATPNGPHLQPRSSNPSFPSPRPARTSSSASTQWAALCASRGGVVLDPFANSQVRRKLISQQNDASQLALYFDPSFPTSPSHATSALTLDRRTSSSFTLCSVNEPPVRFSTRVPSSPGVADGTGGGQPLLQPTRSGITLSPDSIRAGSGAGFAAFSAESASRSRCHSAAATATASPVLAPRQGAGASSPMFSHPHVLLQRRDSTQAAPPAVYSMGSLVDERSNVQVRLMQLSEEGCSGAATSASQAPEHWQPRQAPNSSGEIEASRFSLPRLELQQGDVSDTGAFALDLVCRSQRSARPCSQLTVSGQGQLQHIAALQEEPLHGGDGGAPEQQGQDGAALPADLGLLGEQKQPAPGRPLSRRLLVLFEQQLQQQELQEQQQQHGQQQQDPLAVRPSSKRQLIVPEEQLMQQKASADTLHARPLYAPQSQPVLEVQQHPLQQQRLKRGEQKRQQQQEVRDGGGDIGSNDAAQRRNSAASVDFSFGNSFTGKASYMFDGALRLLNLRPGQFVTCLVMEYCDRGSLSGAIKRGLFSPSERWGRGTALRALIRTAKEVAQGLSYLHSVNITHGDLKPGNVLLKRSRLDRRGFTVRLADFGFSSISGQGDDGRGMSTVAYSAPETLDGPQTPATDVWSFGVLLYEMITGDQPFLAMHWGGLLATLAQGEASSCLEWPASTHPVLRRLGVACTSEDPSRRPSAHVISKVMVKLEDSLKRTSSGHPMHRHHASAGALAGSSAHGGAGPSVRSSHVHGAHPPYAHASMQRGQTPQHGHGRLSAHRLSHTGTSHTGTSHTGTSHTGTSHTGTGQT